MPVPQEKQKKDAATTNGKGTRQTAGELRVQKGWCCATTPEDAPPSHQSASAPKQLVTAAAAAVAAVHSNSAEQTALHTDKPVPLLLPQT